MSIQYCVMLCAVLAVDTLELGLRGVLRQVVDVGAQGLKAGRLQTSSTVGLTLSFSRSRSRHLMRTLTLLATLELANHHLPQGLATDNVRRQ